MPIFDCKCPYCGAKNEDVHLDSNPLVINHVECAECGQLFNGWENRQPPRVGIAFKGGGWTKRGAY